MSNAVRGLIGLAAAALLTVAPRPAEAISVDVLGAPASVTSGDTFTIQVVVTGIIDEIISAWDIDVGFDGSVVQNSVIAFNSYAAMGGGTGDALYDGYFFADYSDAFTLSLLSDADLRALQCPGDVCGPSFLLASFTFTAIADGVANIGLINWGLANDIKCADNVQCYPPTATPEPGTLGLLGLGILGLGLSRRRRES